MDDENFKNFEFYYYIHIVVKHLDYYLYIFNMIYNTLYYISIFSAHIHNSNQSETIQWLIIKKTKDTSK